MPRPGGRNERGYNAAHRRRARQLKANMHDGDPCARCGGPMYRADLARIHADHVDTPLAEGGTLPDALSHGSCNERHGAYLKAARARGVHGPGPRAPAPLPTW